MTSLFAAGLLCMGLAGQPSPPYQAIEVSQPGSGRLILQAHFRLPFGLGRREAAAWQVMTSLLKEGTLDFTPSQYVQQGNGVRPKFFIGRESLCIQVEGVRGSLPAMVQMVDSMMRRPLYKEDAVSARIKVIERGPNDAWQKALTSESVEWERVRMQHVLDLHSQTLRPENLVLVVSGDLEPQESGPHLLPFAAPLPPAAKRGPVRFDPPAPFAAPGGRGLRAVSLRARLASNSVDEGALSLAVAAALGQGKGSSLYRLVREREAEAYQVTGFIEPGPSWTWRAVALQSKGRKLTPKKTLELLMADIKEWGPNHLKRAKSTAASGLALETFDSLLSIGPTRIMPGVETDAYLRGSSRGLLSLQGLESALGKVDLESLKAEATALLQRAEGAESSP